MINPGEIFMADLDQTHPHPVVVVSREDLNRGDYVVAAVITSAKFAVRSTLANCVVLHVGQFGMTKDCVIQGETVSPIPIDQLDLTGGPLGPLTTSRCATSSKPSVTSWTRTASQPDGPCGR